MREMNKVLRGPHHTEGEERNEEAKSWQSTKPFCKKRKRFITIL
jgi:hypothetical protein